MGTSFFGTIFGALNQDKEQSKGLKIDQSVNCSLKYFIMYCFQPALPASAHYASGTSLSLRCAWSRTLLHCCSTTYAPKASSNLSLCAARWPTALLPKGRGSPRAPSSPAPSPSGLVQQGGPPTAPGAPQRGGCSAESTSPPTSGTNRRSVPADKRAPKHPTGCAHCVATAPVRPQHPAEPARDSDRASSGTCWSLPLTCEHLQFLLN